MREKYALCSPNLIYGSFSSPDGGLFGWTPAQGLTLLAVMETGLGKTLQIGMMAEGTMFPCTLPDLF